MRNLLPLFIISLIIVSSMKVSGQQANAPKWLEGEWHNSFEFNDANWVILAFSSDSIFIHQETAGYSPGDECLNVKYKNYRKKVDVADSLFRVTFLNTSDSIVYEFKLNKTICMANNVLTYSLKINHDIKHEHSTDCKAIFIKLEETKNK